MDDWGPLFWETTESLHDFLCQVLVLRNVPIQNFDSDRIKRFLSSLTYLSSHHTFNQERLEVPETELFEALQLHRRFMVKWLVEQRRINALSGFNSVLRSCHHQLSALGYWSYLVLIASFLELFLLNSSCVFKASLPNSLHTHICMHLCYFHCGKER